MKRLCIILAILIFVSGCTWSRNYRNEEKRSARIAVMTGQCFKDLYMQSLLSAQLMSELGSIKAGGVSYLLDVAVEAEKSSNATVHTLDSFARGDIRSSAVEAALEKLQQDVLKLSAPVEAFLANEGILPTEVKP